MKKFVTLTFLIFYFSQFLSSYVENEDSAPEFKLSDSYGNEISLSSFIGKKLYWSGQIMGVLMLQSITRQEICSLLKNLPKKKKSYG